MADPIITPQALAAIGALGGAALKPNNPLQGALLGGIAGYTGGSLYGASQVAAPAASAVSNPLLNSQIAAQAAQPAMSYAGGNIANAAASTLPNSAAGLSFAGMSPGAASTSGVGIGTGGFEGMKKFAYENPGLMMTGLNSTKELLTPEQMPQMSAAPAMPVQRGPGLKPYDPMASLDPYKQSVVGGQPISLI